MSLFVPVDPELERNAIGLALAGYPWPDWVTVDDFAGYKARLAAQAALATEHSLPAINAWLRERGLTTQYAESTDGLPYRWSAQELVSLHDEAVHAVDMGWLVDFDRLRELSKQRKLLEVMRRVEIRLKNEDCDFQEACSELSGVM